MSLNMPPKYSVLFSESTSSTLRYFNDYKSEINSFELLQMACYPMLNNHADQRVHVQLHISVDNEVIEILEQSWPKGAWPDINLAMHMLHIQSPGYNSDELSDKRLLEETLSDEDDVVVCVEVELKVLVLAT